MERYTYRRTALAELQGQRRRQVADLKGPVFDPLEERIELTDPACLKILLGGDEVGYAIVDESVRTEITLLEFYLDPGMRRDAGRILDDLMEAFHCGYWFVNSRDAFALPLLLEKGFSYGLDAFLFSAGPHDREPPPRGGTTVVCAVEEDLESTYALIMQDGFYTGDGPEGLAERIRSGEIYLLRDQANLLGVGFVCPLERTPKYADIAMIIDGDHRGRGFAFQLVTRLIRISRDKGLVPTALTSPRNVASRRTLEKCGCYVDGCVLRAGMDHRTGGLPR